MHEQDSQAMAKAKAFFEKAEKVAKTANFEYAIDMYLEGLRYTPDAVEQGHVPLCELALHRSGAGGKKPSMMEKVKRMGGKNPLEQMLNAEYLFVKDPDHIPYAEAMLKAAVEGDYTRTANWIANLIFQTNNTAEKPSLHTYILLKDSYVALGEYDKAVAACQRAARLKPDDKELADQYKNLSAELTMSRGKYDGESDFRNSIKDRENQEKLHAQSGVVKTDDYRVKAIENARRKVAQNPDLPANIFELADALSDMENEQSENDAIALLDNTYKSKSDFSFKERAGLIKIKQLKRKIRHAKTAIEGNPEDAKAKEELEKLLVQLNDTELEHYQLCMKNYPTSLKAKFDYAVRLANNKKYNEAIPLLQEAQKDPRRKIASQNQIGLCFFAMGWKTDAIDVFSNALESYKLKDSAIGKELRYNLARAYEENGDIKKALDVYRKIAQSDFGYKDVSQRVNKIRSDNQKPISQ